MTIKKIKHIGCFLVATIDGGALNCHRTYERVYTYYAGKDRYYYSTGGKCALMRWETDPENIKMLDGYVRAQEQAATSGQKGGG